MSDYDAHVHDIARMNAERWNGVLRILGDELLTVIPSHQMRELLASDEPDDAPGLRAMVAQARAIRERS